MNKNKQSHNNGLQILRGLCAVQVLLSHVLYVFKSTFIENIKDSPLHFFFDGQCAVIIFFFISGFFYYKENNNFTYKLYLDKIQKKIYHIFPVFLIATIIGYFVCNLYNSLNIINDNDNYTDWINSFWNKKIEILDLLKTLTIILTPDFNQINPPTWYLDVEVRMFIILPILIHLFNKISWLYAYIFLIVSIIYPIPFIPDIKFFILGAITHRLILKKRFIKRRVFINKIILIIIGIVLLNIKNEIPQLNYIINKNIVSIIQSIGVVFIVYVFYHTKVCLNKIYNKILLFIGNISYEIYIIHFIIILTLKPFITNQSSFIISVLLITIITGYILHSLSLHINNKIYQE